MTVDVTPLTAFEVDRLEKLYPGFRETGVIAAIRALQFAFNQGGDYKDSVRLATTAPLAACTYANGNSGVGATLTANANGAFGAHDGVTPAVGDRILVKNQVAGLQNGIYVFTSIGGAGSKWVLTRADDADTSDELSPSFCVPVEQGTANGEHLWQMSAGTITVGTTSLSFTESSIGPVSVLAALAAVASRVDINEQHIQVGGVEFESGADLTLDAAGAIVPTHGQHRLIPFGGAGSGADTLVTITPTNFTDGGMLFLQAEGTAGDIITIQGSGGGAGTVVGPAGSNIELGVTANDWALLIYDGTNWNVVAHSRSLSGARFGTGEDALVIAVGAITPTGVGRVSCEAGAALTDLDTIVASNYLPGQTITLRATTVGQISRFTAAGNIDVPSGMVLELGHHADDRITLLWDGTAWHVVGLALAGHAEVNVRFATVANAASPYTVLAQDWLLLADTTAGNVQFDLPAVATSAGRVLRLVKTIAANSMILDGNAAETINGAATQTYTSQWSAVDIYCDGTSWYTIGTPRTSEGEAGLIELASQAEVTTGTDGLRAVTPATHAAFAGTFTGATRSHKAHAAFAGSARVETTAAVETTDATATTLWSLTLVDDTAYWVEADIVAREITGAGTSENSYKRRCLVSRRAAGAAALGGAGSVALYTDEEDLDWACDFDVNVNDVRLRVTGDAATTSLAWAATIRYQAVGGVA